MRRISGESREKERQKVEREKKCQQEGKQKKSRKKEEGLKETRMTGKDKNDECQKVFVVAVRE